MSNKIKSFVTELQPITQQVGTHILTALSEDGTAAVLTSIVPGLASDRVASVPVSREQLMLINQILHAQQQKMIEEPTDEEDRSIGFQIEMPSKEE